ncbi:MAG: DNA/RNA nuclease SfsA [Thermofilaceae archaeon]
MLLNLKLTYIHVIPLIELPEPIKCKILERRNRFVVEVLVKEEHALAHITNTGRLTDYLIHGRIGYCLPKYEGVTKFKLIAVEDRGKAALIDTGFQMQAFEKALNRKLIPWAACRIITRAPKLSSSRLDYLLKCGSYRMFVEVKSAVLRDGFYAMYPDCPTMRGRRHLSEISEYVKKGGKALIVFIAALPDVKAFKPYEKGDPEIPLLLAKAAEAGVTVKAVSMHYEPSTSCIFLDNPDLPVYI